MDLQGSNSEDLRRLRLLRQSQGPLRVTVAPERNLIAPSGNYIVRRSPNLRTEKPNQVKPKTEIQWGSLLNRDTSALDKINAFSDTAADKIGGGFGRGVLRGIDYLVPGVDTLGTQRLRTFAEDWDKRANLSASKQKDQAAAQAGRRFGSVVKGAGDVGLLIAGTGAVDKATKGSTIARNLDKGGKVSRFLSGAYQRTIGSLAGTGGQSLIEVGQGKKDLNLAQNTAVGIGVDVVGSPILGKIWKYAAAGPTARLLSKVDDPNVVRTILQEGTELSDDQLDTIVDSIAKEKKAAKIKNLVEDAGKNIDIPTSSTTESIDYPDSRPEKIRGSNGKTLEENIANVSKKISEEESSKIGMIYNPGLNQEVLDIEDLRINKDDEGMTIIGNIFQTKNGKPQLVLYKIDHTKQTKAAEIAKQVEIDRRLAELDKPSTSPQALEQAVEALPPNTAISQQTPVTAAPEGVPSTSADIAQADVGNLADEAAQQAEGMKNLYGKETLVQKIAKLWDPLSPLRKMDKARAKALGIRAVDLPKTQSTEALAQVSKNSKEMAAQALKDTNTARVIQKYQTKGPDSTDFNFYRVAMRDLEQRADGRPAIFRELDDNSLNNWIAEYEARNPEARQDLLDIVADVRAFQDYGAELVSPEDLARVRLKKDGTEFQFWTPIQRATPDDVATPVISGQNIGTVGRQKILQEQLGSDLPPDVSFDALTDYVETVYKQVNQAKVARTVTENVQAGLVPGARVIQTGDESARIAQLRQTLGELRDVSKSLQTELKAVRSKVRLAKKDVAIAGKQLGIADEKQAGKVRMAKSDYTRKVNEATSQAKRLLKQMLSDDVDSASAIDSLTPDELVDLLGVSTQDELFSKGAKGKAQFRAVSNSKDKLFGTPPKQDSIEPLIEEARKYKSASEYADSIQNPKPTKDGYVVAYHGTGADNIDSIKQNGFNLSKRNKGSESPDSHFFVVGDNPKGQYGGSTVAVQIPKEIADAYGGTTKGNVLYIPDSLAKKIEVLTTDKLLIDNKRKSDFFKDLDNKRYTVENVEEALNRNIYDKTTTQNVREAIAEYKQLTDLYNQATQSPKSIPEEGIIQQTSKQQEAAYARIAKKSEAHRQMVERLQDLKMDIESADNARKGIGRELVELRPDSITGRQTILGIDENGNKFRVELPPEYASVLQGTDKEQMNTLLRGLRIAQQPWREAYTGILNPPFQIAQATFNAIMAPILKGHKVFGPRAMKAAVEAFNGHSLSQQALREGGITIYGGNLQKLVKDTTADALASQADTLSRAKWFANPKRAWEQLSLAGGKLDQAARAAMAQVEYDNAIARNLSHEDAMAAAVYTYNNSLPNFGNAASLITQVDAVIPYFAAGQTGTRQIMRAIKENPIGVGGRMATFGLALSGITAYNLAKDEGEAFYTDMENSGKKYVLDNNVIFVLPGARKDPKTGEWTGIVKIPLPPELRPLGSAVRATFSPTSSGVPVKEYAAGVFNFVTGGTASNRSPAIQTGYGLVTGKDPQTGRDIYDETMTDEERRAAAAKYAVGSFGLPGKVVTKGIGEVPNAFVDRVYGAKGISEGGQYYKNEGEAIKQVGLNKNELDAYRSTIAPRSKDLAGNDIKDKTYYDSASKAVTWLRYPKTFEVSKAMDAKNRAAGKPGDPLFDLPPDQLKIVLNLMANYSPGNFEEKAIQQLNPWIKDFNKKRSEYFDKVIPADKKGSTDAMGITIPKATPQLQTKLDQVSKITDKKQKAQYYADNPDITDYYKKTEDYQRTKRAFLGLPQFDRYPTASKEVQGYMDTYNALPKGNGPLKKDGTPSSPDRSAWIKSHPNEWAALTEQWAKQDIFNTQKEGAEAVYEGIDMEQDTVDKLAGALGTTKQGFYDQYGNIDKETALNLLKLLSPDKDYTFKSPDTKIKVQKVRYKIPKSVGKKSKVKLG